MRLFAERVGEFAGLRGTVIERKNGSPKGVTRPERVEQAAIIRGDRAIRHNGQDN